MLGAILLVSVVDVVVVHLFVDSLFTINSTGHGLGYSSIDTIG